VKTTLRPLLLAWSCLLSVQAAESSSLEARLRALELKVETLQQENNSLRHQLGATAKEAGIQIKPLGQESTLVIGGFTQMQAEFGGLGDARFAGATDRIYVRRSRLALAGSFNEFFEFRIEGDFGANSVTPGNGLRAQANEIMLGWKRYPGAVVRLGQLKSAYSAELLATEYKGPLIERSLGAERLGDGRQLGATVGGEFLNQRVGYLIFAGNGNGSNSSANDNRKFLQSARAYAVAFDTPAAGKLTLGADALHSADAGLSKPGTGFDSVAGGAVDNLFTGTRDGWGFDAMWHLGRFEVSTEFLRMRYQPVNAIPRREFLGEAWQLTASYFIVPQKLQAAFRRENFDPNHGQRGDSSDNWLVGLSYYLKGDDLRIMVDYLFGHPAGLSGDQGRLLTRFQVVY
jgi:phosphate-selective porin